MREHSLSETRPSIVSALLLQEAESSFLLEDANGDLTVHNIITDTTNADHSRIVSYHSFVFHNFILVD